MPLVRRTRATLRRAEFGFLGVTVDTFMQTPLLNGEEKYLGLFFRTLKPRSNAGVFDLALFGVLPLLTNWCIVGIPVVELRIHKLFGPMNKSYKNYVDYASYIVALPVALGNISEVSLPGIKSILIKTA